MLELYNSLQGVLEAHQPKTELATNVIKQLKKSLLKVSTSGH